MKELTFSTALQIAFQKEGEQEYRKQDKQRWGIEEISQYRI